MFLFALIPKASGCEVDLPGVASWMYPYDGQARVPTDAVVRVVAQVHGSALAEPPADGEFTLVGADGVGRAGSTERGPIQAVFRPDEALVPGVYTAVYGDLASTFTVQDRLTAPPSAPPDTGGGSVRELEISDYPCAIFSPGVAGRMLAGNLGEADSTDEDGALAWAHVIRLADAEDPSLDPAFTIGFRTLARGSGPVWPAAGAPGPECLRLIEEDAAGHLSEPSEVACFVPQVERGCDLAGGAGWVAVGMAGLLGTRRASGRRQRWAVRGRESG